MSTVGIIVNPNAGKDIRRLVTPATHTSDVTKVGIVRRAIVAAAESGATRILLMPDRHRLAERAAAGLDLTGFETNGAERECTVEIVDEPLTGSRFDTIAAARRFWKEQVGAVIALGGDGTSRDVALGWPDAPLIAISTGTNNVYPSAIDGTSAGAAAALVASGHVDIDRVGRRSKRVTVRIDDVVFDGDEERHVSRDDLALVDLAFIDAQFVGARAVRDPSTPPWPPRPAPACRVLPVASTRSTAGRTAEFSCVLVPEAVDGCEFLWRQGRSPPSTWPRCVRSLSVRTSRSSANACWPSTANATCR